MKTLYTFNSVGRVENREYIHISYIIHMFYIILYIVIDVDLWGEKPFISPISV